MARKVPPEDFDYKEVKVISEAHLNIDFLNSFDKIDAQVILRGVNNKDARLYPSLKERYIQHYSVYCHLWVEEVVNINSLDNIDFFKHIHKGTKELENVNFSYNSDPELIGLIDYSEQSVCDYIDKRNQPDISHTKTILAFINKEIEKRAVDSVDPRIKDYCIKLIHKIDNKIISTPTYQYVLSLIKVKWPKAKLLIQEHHKEYYLLLN